MTSFMYTLLLGLTLVIAVCHIQLATAICPIPPPPNGARIKFPRNHDSQEETKERGESIRIVCNDDYTMVNGNGFMTCLQNGEWSDTFTCRETRICRLLQIRNGEIVYHGRARSKIAKYSCHLGYDLIGERKRSCLSNGTWSGERPQCKGKPKCSNPTITEGLRIEVIHGEQRGVDDLWIYNSRLEFSCQRGYEITGPTVLECKQRWNASLPYCFAITCDPLLENITNGISSARNRTYRDTQTIFYYCDDGYRTSSQSWRVCVVTRADNGERVYMWTGVTPICEEIRCTRPGRIENGVTTVSSNYVGGNTTFRCNSGYELHGSATITCKRNGQWTDTIPICSDGDTYCPPLSAPLNGQKNGLRYNHYNFVDFTCNSNYALIGSSRRRCESDGAWNGEETRCIGSNDFDDINDISATFGQMITEMEMNTVTGPDVNVTNTLGRFIPISHEKGVDLLFMFDASQSVGLQNFNHAKQFAKKLVAKINVTSAHNSLRVGALSFSSEAKVDFGTTIYTTTREVEDAIDDIEYIGEGTNLAKAFGLVRTTMLPQTEGLGRPDSYQTVFLITDGNANEGGDPDKDASDLKDLNVKIHCFGISENASRQEMANIASEPIHEHLFLIKDYIVLDDVVNAVTNQALDYSPCGVSPPSKTKSRSDVIGDVDAKEGAWPWQAYIEIVVPGSSRYLCGGSLIARRWILTAAHCIHHADNEVITVHLGVTDSSEPSPSPRQIIGVLRSIAHPNYNRSVNHDSDIALLELESDAILNPYVRTVCLPDAEAADKLIPPFPVKRPRIGIATGWGHAGPVGINVDPNFQYRYVTLLQQVSLPLKPRQVCIDSLGGRISLFTENMFCAGFLNVEIGLCKGDSGGPLVRKVKGGPRSDLRWTIIGITSWGEGCQQSNQLDFFTHVPRLVEWVKNTIQPNNDEGEDQNEPVA